MQPALHDYPLVNCDQQRARCAPLLMLTLLIAAILFGVAVPNARAEAKVDEYDVKAAWLLHFVEFTDWPDSAYANAQTPISIGVLGDDPFGAKLDNALQGQVVHNRKVVIKRSGKADDLRDCHLVFVSKSEKEQIPQILNAFGNAPILVVSEVDGFASQGGAINFYLANDKVRFEINADAAKRRALKIDSRLLRLGRLVR